MSDKLDYEKLKFKAGLEIHQQLDADGKKLFCNCPALLRKDEPDFLISRKLHAVAGESGEVDVAAQHEIKKDKEFFYQGYDTTCLVELDEEPPKEINKSALKIVVQIALLLNCKIISISQVMRKTVIDGSNTSGFQRTVMIARDGYVETSHGKVKIEGIYLEEDSARPIERKEKKATYRLDRLGIPLVEISTDASMKNPEQVKEVALHIGEVLRSCKIRRGIGTIRQDVNVSIRGENRVELKGMQDMKTFVKTIENEVLRQKKLSDSKNPTEAEVRNALNNKNCKTEFLRPMPGAARMYPETDLPLLKIKRDFINEAKKTLPKLRGEVKKELKNKGLNEEMIKLLFKNNKIREFKELLEIINNPQLITKVLLIFPREIASKKKMDFLEILEKTEDEIPKILKSVKEEKIPENKIKYVLSELIEGKKLENIKIEQVDVADIEENILKIIKEKPGLSVNAYMGLVMKNSEFRGKISGKEVMEIIKKYMK